MLDQKELKEFESRIQSSFQASKQYYNPQEK